MIKSAKRLPNMNSRLQIYVERMSDSFDKYNIGSFPF